MLNILMQSSDFYSPFAGVMLTSLFENNKDSDEIEVFLINDGISEENLRRFTACSDYYNRKITFIDAAGITNTLETLGVKKYHGSYTTMLKLFAISQLPESVDRILYIDSDTLVVSSLSGILSFDMCDSVCAMVEHSTALHYINVIGLKDRTTWYNGGVVLFNVKKWKEDNSTQKIVDALTDENVFFPFVDEDILNMLFYDKIKRLSCAYNFPVTYDSLGLKLTQKIYKLSDEQYKELEVAAANAVVLHLFPLFGLRPWEEGFEGREKEQWDKYLRMSCWSDYVKSKKSVSVVNKFQKLLYDFLPEKMYAPIHRAAYIRKVKKDSKGFTYGE